MGFPLFVEKVLQYRFGIDTNEFLSKGAIEDVDVAGMNAEAVVDHREMMDAFIFEPIDRQHHVGGIHGMNKMRDDPVGLLP